MRSLKVRRAAVILAGGLFAGLLVCGAFSLWKGGREWLWWGLGCAAAALAVSCLLAASGIPGRNSGQLDARSERQILEAMAGSYRMLTGLLALSAAGAFFLDMAEIEPAPGGDWKTLLLALVLLVPFFPAALLAWRVPDAADSGEPE
jgi:hypothetical protein